ncbi:hypothetical protein LG634_24905 [Streptomyces bambusae]|uniref:hypothetical protein n=1 Tax=Streptomyces bambusae TaxID=1550616 RepID=UPI001CFD35C6|nr:hypothetical protein [Streptomyces bambusae]MCB5168054.1 hypothetical protein [Streptomyces bambusae]
MSAREELIAHTASLLWQAWAGSAEEMASQAAATLYGLGMLVPEGGSVELERLRMMTEAQPADLSEDQLGALIDAGNRAVNDFYHERACACSAWPTSCLTNPHYANGAWSSDAFAIGAAALVGVWEALRSDAAMAEVVRLRAQVAELQAESVGVRETIAADIERRGQGFPAGHPAAPHVRVFAEVARGRDVLPRREAAPPPDPRRAESAERVAALVAGQRAAAAAEQVHDGPELHTYTTARLREDQP